MRPFHFATFGSLRQAALVFTGIPLAVTGGILPTLYAWFERDGVPPGAARFTAGEPG